MRITGLSCVLASCAVALALAACNGATTTTSASPPLSPLSGSGSGSPGPIQHIVLMIQENRSFNDFFATFPGTDGTTTGEALANSSCSPPIAAGPIALTEEPLVLPKDLDHRWYDGYQIAYDNGKMDAFDNVPFVTTHTPECSYPYMYTNPSQIAPYWTLASEYALAEHMFTTQGSDSFTAHQDLIRGGTIVEPNKAMVDIPSDGSNWWGCDAPRGTKTHLLNKLSTKYIKNGPFPCSNKFQSTYDTLRDLLDAKGITWKYYVPPKSQIYGKLLSAFDLVYPVRYGSEWTTNIITPETQILNDVQNDNLAQMSWVIPDENNSDHPGTTVDDGPSWVASVVNAIGQSSYWDSTAIIIVWDDWGGIYDNEGGAISGYGGPGERVPAIIVSPYAKAGYISTTTYQFGSILHYIENNWGLGSLGTTDNATSILDCFNYSQTPITFQPITSSLGKSYFLHEKHSYRPPDNDW
jgi:phospholipase C